MRHFLSTAIIAVFSVSSSYAGDVGTYRPGNIYLSVPAQSPDQCSAQCSGDAQCKSWNFVKVRPEQAVCEFNSRKSHPVTSPISISGDNPTAYDSARLVPIGHRTTRIGQTASSHLVPQPGSVTRVGAIPAPQSRVQTPRQRIVQPVPQSVNPILARSSAVRAPSPQANAVHAPVRHQAPMPFSHSLESQPPAPVRAPVPAPVHAPVQQPQTPASENRPVRSPFASRAATTPQTGFKPLLDSQIAQRPPAAQRPQTESYSLPKPSMPSLSEIPQNVLAPSIESGLAGGPTRSAPPSGNSLYGSLYDDVKAPKILTREDIPTDPNAPIPTVTSVPIEKLDVQPF